MLAYRLRLQQQLQATCALQRPESVHLPRWSLRVAPVDRTRSAAAAVGEAPFSGVSAAAWPSAGAPCAAAAAKTWWASRSPLVACAMAPVLLTLSIERLVLIAAKLGTRLMLPRWDPRRSYGAAALASHSFTVFRQSSKVSSIARFALIADSLAHVTNSPCR